MVDLSVYAQAKLLFKLINPPDNLVNDFVELQGLDGTNLRVDAFYDLTTEEAEIVSMLQISS